MSTTKTKKEIEPTSTVRLRRTIKSKKEAKVSSPVSKSPDKSAAKSGHFNAKRIILYLILFSSVSFAGLVVDFLFGGKYGAVLRPFIDHAFPPIDDPDVGKTAEDFARSRGFEFEQHEVKTEDGYIIEFHRIYNKDFSNTVRPALVIGVPLFCSSIVSLLDYRNNSIGYIFADAGYDVWLTNTRGNRYGLRHVSLDPVKDKLAFYDYSPIEVGQIDLATQIDYVLNLTGQEKVYYAGQSQGAVTAFILLSKKPEYNSKIHAIAAFGGCRSLCFAKNIAVNILSKFMWPVADFILKLEPISAIWPHLTPMHMICARTGNLCGHILVHSGFKSEYYLNISRWGVYTEYVPAGTSLKTIFYYGQTLQTGCDGSARDFDYDYGPITSLLIRLGLKESMNMKIYGTPEPPLLDPKNIRVPVKMYYSDGDDYTPEEEVFKVAAEVGIPSSNLHRIADDRFSHLNFIFNPIRKDFVYHSIDFFRGGNASWPYEEKWANH